MSTEDPNLKKFVDPDKLQQELHIDAADIDGAMRQQASMYAYYATQAVYARRQHERYKLALEKLEGRLDKEYRESQLNAGEGKKPTEPMIRAAIVNDSRWQIMSQRVIDAQEQFKLAEVAEKAWGERKDMLLQMSRSQLKEMDGSLRVANNRAGRERLAEMMAGAKVA